MHLEKLKKIAAKSSGGGGAPRRKTKSGAGKAANNVESKVRSAARSLKAQEISPRFDDVMLIRTDGSAVGLRQPRIDAKLESNMYVVSSDNAEIRSAMQVQSIKQQMDQQAMTMALQQMGMGGMMKQAEERLATNHGKRVVPPPPPAMAPSKDAMYTLPKDPRVCPICRQKIVNPAMVSRTGIVSCYRCLFLHIEQHSSCPVTGRGGVTKHDVRRLISG